MALSVKGNGAFFSASTSHGASLHLLKVTVVKETTLPGRSGAKDAAGTARGGNSRGAGGRQAGTRVTPVSMISATATHTAGDGRVFQGGRAATTCP